jgi:SAM-dependent methyltransferase
VPDAQYTDPRLAALYDPLEGERPDLDLYLAIAGELGARTALDVGCGTGTLAVLLAEAGLRVLGVDPAEASLAVARSRPGADRVDWLLGDAGTLPPLAVDLATMTGNVAQAILDEEDWIGALGGIRDALTPAGHLVFETRDPAARAWREWTPDRTRLVRDVPGVGRVEHWIELTDVSGPLVSFRSSYRFPDGAVLTSDSTLRFRERDEIEETLRRLGYGPAEVRDAPDRPGLEFVVVVPRAG